VGGLTSSLRVDARLINEAFNLPRFARGPWLAGLGK
jgi:hypothetical protein